MCGIFGFLTSGPREPARRADGPDDARGPGLPRARQRRGGRARPGRRAGRGRRRWTVRVAGPEARCSSGARRLGRVEDRPRRRVDSPRPRPAFDFRPAPGVTADDVERALGARRGGLEVLSLGRRLDLVKQVGSPAGLEAAYGLSAWRGPLAIGHTRMSTESRIDLSHSQPFWAHGVPDLATVHNGHVTNYHQLRRHYEQRGVTFYTDNDSEVIGVYLRDASTGAGPCPRRWPTRSPTSTARTTTSSRRPRGWGSSATASASSR